MQPRDPEWSGCSTSLDLSTCPFYARRLPQVATRTHAKLVRWGRGKLGFEGLQLAWGAIAKGILRSLPSRIDRVAAKSDRLADM